MTTAFEPKRDLEILPDGTWHCKYCQTNSCDHLSTWLGFDDVGAHVLAKFIGSYSDDTERTADIILPTESGDALHVDFRRTATQDVWQSVLIGPTGVEVALTMIAVGTDSFSAIESALAQVMYCYVEDGSTCGSKEHFKRSKDVMLSTGEDIYSYLMTGLCKKCATGRTTDFDKFVPESDASMPSVWGSGGIGSSAISADITKSIASMTAAMSTSMADATAAFEKLGYPVASVASGDTAKSKSK